MFQEILRRLRARLTRDDQARAAIDHVAQHIGVRLRPTAWDVDGSIESDMTMPVSPVWHDQQTALSDLAAQHLQLAARLAVLEQAFKRATITK